MGAKRGNAIAGVFFLLLLVDGTVFAASERGGRLNLPSVEAQKTGGLSFSECYKAALARSENLAIQDELLVQADELERQARATLFPVITGSATFLRQQRATAPNPANLTSQNTIKITGDQPLFRGLREFAAIRQRKAQVEGQRAALQDAARQLFYDVSDAFHNTLALQADEQNYRNELAVNRARLKDLEDFRRIGRSRNSEVLTQRANIASLEAQIEVIHGQLEVQRDVLAFHTGLPRIAALLDSEPAPKGAEPALESFLANLDQRPDILAAKAAAESSEDAVSVAKGTHWPSADLIGNYYPERTGSQSTVKWDASLVVTLPIFQGGAIQSQVRQAASVHEQASLALARVRRVAEQEIRRFYFNVAAARQQVAKLAEFVELSKQNYQALQRDYRNGLVTNLEVLQSITNWQAAQRNWEHQQFALKNDFLKLQGASAKRAEIFIESLKIR
jgi:outer membrane protein